MISTWILIGPDWALGPLFYPEEGLPAHIINNISYLTHIDPEIETVSLFDTLTAQPKVTLFQLSRPDSSSTWYQLISLIFQLMHTLPKLKRTQYKQ
jgi:hypothetical protein